MVQCAVFLAMSFVIRIVEQSFPITMGGVNFMKLGLSAPFTLVPAILFGPIYGLVTFILRELIAQHASIAFMIYYIPRIAKTLIISVLAVIIMNDILSAFRQKTPTSRNVKGVAQ